MPHRPERDFGDAVCQPFLMIGTGVDGKRHGVLLLHGFTGSVAHMRPLADVLHGQGFTVMGVNLPGHATTMDDMARATWEDWLGAAKEAFLRLKGMCDHISVAGLSMGGCLALILAEQMQPDAVAALSAPMGTKAPLWLTGVASPFMRNVWWKHREDAANHVDQRYDYGYPGFRTVCGPHLNRLIRMSRRDLHAVTCPVLVVQSRTDGTIIADSAEIILKGVSSAQRRMLWLDAAPHVCTLSSEGNRIAAAVGAHFHRATGD